MYIEVETKKKYQRKPRNTIPTHTVVSQIVCWLIKQKARLRTPGQMYIIDRYNLSVIIIDLVSHQARHQSTIRKVFHRRFSLSADFWQKL